MALGLNVKRHRLIESNFSLMTPTCRGHPRGQDYFVIHGHECRQNRDGARRNDIAGGRAAMGIDWMNRGELSEAIPPAYAEWVGRAALAKIGSAAMQKRLA